MTAPEPAGGSRRRVWVLVVALVAVPASLLAAAALWFWWQLDPPGGPGEAVEVRVDDGWSVARIGEELAAQDVISSSFVFTVYARLSGTTDFQAGTYELRRDMGVRDAVSTLEAGPRLDYVELAVPPGLWLVEVADRVGSLPGRDADAFLEATRNGAVRSRYQPEGQASLEGLLWPDTYRVAEAEDEIDIAAAMAREFEEHADAVGLADATTGGLTPYQIVVVASLVEAEAKVDEDRALIASVIYNRLRDGMPLQIDASVLYAIGDPGKQTITAADLRTESPFNTYVVTGLPPTPIGSVSEASLRAAITPAQTDFRFYVIADEQGRHAFSRTFEEHQANVALARERGLL